MAKRGLYIPILIVVLIVGLIIYLVSNTKNSPIQDCVKGFSKVFEGFATADTTNAVCPPKYRFFNDSVGETLCCAGKVDPHTHQCLDKGRYNTCSFVPGVVDQRDPRKGFLPLCKDIMRELQNQAEKEFCPRSLPHHASTGRCCANPTDPLTGNCLQTDLQRQEGYCLTTADRKDTDIGKPIYGDLVMEPGVGSRPAEQLCSNLRALEMAKCPGTLQINNVPIQETTYGGIKRSFENVCLGRDGMSMQTCFEENELQRLVAMDPRLKNFPVKQSIFNCDVFRKVKLDKDLSFPADYTDGNGNRIA
jgi:hypothetical protein